jgi:hypothetical protein
MAKKVTNEPMQSGAETSDETELSDQEKPISPEAGAREGEEGDDASTFGLSPEQREQKRLARKPRIDHLRDGTTIHDAEVIPLFDVGDRIVAERHISFLAGHPWLDTWVYVVRSIDDAKGEVHCTDEEMRHYACVGFKHPFTRIKLAPAKGDPFRVPKREKVQAPLQPGEKKRRGRPKGSKNRPKEVIEAERKAKKENRT